MINGLKNKRMILTKKIKIKASGISIKYYRELGYKINQGEELIIPIEHLHPGSKQVIKVRCDVCSNDKEISHYSYNKSCESYGFYSCSSKCSTEKKKKTFVKKYGVEHVLQSEKIKSKTMATIQKKYGCDNVAKSKEIQDKMKKTNLERYGVENPMKCEEIYDKSKKTKLNRYGNENYRNIEKFKETMINKYGVENPSQLDEVKQKKIDTCMENYGVDYVFQSKEFTEKTRKTNLEKYNNENYRNIEKIKKTLLDKYGVENPSKLDEVKTKKKETCFKNYGVEYPAQNKKIYDKMIKSGYSVKTHKKTGLYYQGSYEKDFLNYCYDNNIDVIRGERIKYKFNDKIKYYFPDFFLIEGNLIIEIKSDYYFNKNKEQNIAKQNECLNKGFNFMFIINKDYNKFENFISSKLSYHHKSLL